MIVGDTLSSRARPLLLAVAAALALAGVAALMLDDGPDHLALARAEVADEQSFTGARSAGEALLRASQRLQAAGGACDPNRSRCDRLLTAAAIARVSSVDVLGCRRPDIFAFRLRFERYLAALQDGDDPLPPPPPACS